MIIGVTGGIGSGKSYVCDILNRRHNIPVINTDIVAKTQIMCDETVMHQVIDTFGKDSYVDGKINIPKFSKLLFNNKEELNKMNNITLPPLIDYVKNFCVGKKDIVIESAALLNTDLYNLMDFVVLVFADMEFRMKALKIRYNNDMELITSRINAQSFNLNMVDYVLQNGDDIEEQVKKLAEKINI